MPATIYIAPAVTDISSRCNVYRIPYHVSNNINSDKDDMRLIGILQWEYIERKFRIVCLDRDKVGDLTDEDFIYGMGGTYYWIND
jgi:hypothetical protein